MENEKEYGVILEKKKNRRDQESWKMGIDGGMRKKGIKTGS